MLDHFRAGARIALLSLMLAAPAAAQTPAPTSPPPAAKPLIGKANPAAVNCAKRGGTSEITVNKRGDEYGWCKLPNGKVCEEWALYRDKACVERKDR